MAIQTPYTTEAMKCYIIFRNLLLLILLSPFHTSAQTSNLTIEGYSDLPERFIYLYRKTGPLGLSTHLDTIPLNQNGEFRFNLYLRQPEDVSLNFGKQRLQLRLNPNTTVTLSLKDSGSVIKGPTSSYTYYYLDAEKEKQRLFEEYEKRHPGFNKKDSKYTDEHFLIFDSISQGKLRFLENYFKSKNLSGKKQFVENEKASILYSDLFYKVQFDTAYKKFLFFQQKLHISGASTYAFSNQVTMDDSKLLSLPTYQRFITTAIPSIAKQKIVEQGEAFSFDLWMDNQMAVIDQLSADPYCNLNNKALVINLFVNQIRMSKRVQWADKLYSLIAQLQPKDRDQVFHGIKEKLDALVKETRFIKGAVAPAFTFTDTAGKIYRLEDFKGKKIYIDVWATWCKPCIALAPAWNKLVNTYKAKDSIIFLSVSIDDTRDNWKEFLKMHHPAGIVLHAGDGGWKSSFAIDYDVYGIPHFILLDKNGKILAYKAPLPDKLEELEKILNAD